MKTSFLRLFAAILIIALPTGVAFAAGAGMNAFAAEDSQGASAKIGAAADLAGNADSASSSARNSSSGTSSEASETSSSEDSVQEEGSTGALRPSPEATDAGDAEGADDTEEAVGTEGIGEAEGAEADSPDSGLDPDADGGAVSDPPASASPFTGSDAAASRGASQATDPADRAMQALARSNEAVPVLAVADNVVELARTLMDEATFFLRQAQDGVITNISATTTSGEDVESLSIWEQFEIHADFVLPNGQVHEGDTTTVQLPAELDIVNSLPFAITDSKGNVVANAVVDSRTKTIVITYTDYPETHSDVSGSFYFRVRVDHTVVQEETDIPLNFLVEGQTIFGGNVHFEGVGTPTARTLNKSGWQSSGDAQTINYGIDINQEKIDIDNAVVGDSLGGTGVSYVQDSIRVEKGTWEIVNGSWTLTNKTNMTSSYAVNWGADGTSFQINLGNISADEGFYVSYNVHVDYQPAEGEIFTNTATLAGSNIEMLSRPARTEINYAGGSAEGYVYSIKIVKSAEDGTLLAGATFEVVRVSSGTTIGSFTTNSSGEVEVTGLLKDSYRIIEVSAPVGYELLDNPVEISPEDFGADKVASVSIVDEPVRVSVFVEKHWIGPTADSVTVNLLADGTQVESATLDADGQWQHTFEGLLKYDAADGHEIAYSVSENAVDGYTSEISGDAESGFTVTNTQNDDEGDDEGDEGDDEGDEGDAEGGDDAGESPTSNVSNGGSSTGGGSQTGSVTSSGLFKTGDDLLWLALGATLLAGSIALLAAYALKRRR